MDTQTLIREIQQRHHLSLKPDDPIFTVITLNELLLANYQEQFKATIEQHAEAQNAQVTEKINQYLESSAHQANQALDVMEARIKEAGNTIETAINATVQANLQKIQQETDSGIQKVRQSTEIIQTIAYLAIAAVFFVLGILFKVYVLH